MSDLAGEPGGAHGDERVPVGGDGESPAEENARQVKKEGGGLNPGMIGVEGGPGLGHPGEDVNRCGRAEHDDAASGGGSGTTYGGMRRGAREGGEGQTVPIARFALSVLSRIQ